MSDSKTEIELVEDLLDIESIASEIYDGYHFWSEDIKEQLDTHDEEWLIQELEEAKVRAIAELENTEKDLDVVLISQFAQIVDIDSNPSPRMYEFSILGISTIQFLLTYIEHQNRETSLYSNVLSDFDIADFSESIQTFNTNTDVESFSQYEKDLLKTLDDDLTIQSFFNTIEEQTPNDVLYDDWPEFAESKVSVSEDWKQNARKLFKVYESLAEKYLKSIGWDGTTESSGSFRHKLNPHNDEVDLPENTLLNSLSEFNDSPTLDMKVRNAIPHGGSGGGIKLMPSNRADKVRVVNENDDVEMYDIIEVQSAVSRIRLICLLFEGMFAYERLCFRADL